MKWLGLLYTLVKIVSWMIDQYKEYGIIKAEEAQALKTQMEAADAEVKKAIAIRKGVVDTLNADPGKLHDDDGFRRD